MKNSYLIFFITLFSFTSVAQNFSKTVTVSAGIPVKIKSGTLISASEITLKSTSDRFSSLFLEEALPGAVIVNYDRHVNLRGGNDLISMPVKSTTAVVYSDFLNDTNGIVSNRDVLPQNPSKPSTYRFGPYSNVSQKYLNYDEVDDGAKELKRGVGYRAAANNAEQTLRFTGSVSTVTETVNITTAGRNRWNLVGNPYPTYLNSQAFLDENIDQLDDNAAAIYGYNSGTREGEGTIGNFTIINRLTYTDQKIAPGQGFLVANKLSTPSSQISFTSAMRVFSGQDDFILNRNENQNKMLRLKAAHKTANFATEIYFNANSTLGLDPGYDAALFDGADTDFMIYSQLVKDNSGRNMAIQSLGFSDMDAVIIPLGIKTIQGARVTFSIESSNLPKGIEVYLEDKQANILTLLNTGDYAFTAKTAISGTGRFFLRMENRALSISDKENKSLQIFAGEQTLFINGQLLADTKVSVYDIQGRLVLTSSLKEGSDRNKINTTTLNTGVYVVRLVNEAQFQTKKVVIR
ncbi:MAG: T9SS type A sorting domain-containing protein [Gelidibacter sp.]